MSTHVYPATLPYEEHRAYVLAVLRRRCRWLDEDEREVAFHDAYVVLLQKGRDGTLDLDAMHERQLRAYLVQTAIHMGLDEGKRAHRTRTTSIEGKIEDTAAAEMAGPDELAAAGQLGSQLGEIVAELPERQQVIVKLRFYFDCTPTEIQRFLDISERAYRREFERAMRYLAGRYELVREERFCDSRRSVILAYVAGIAGPNRAEDARTHIAACPGCAHWAAGLRETARAAAAMLPLPAVVPPGVMERVAGSLAEVRDTLTGHFTSAKQHAIETVTRVDPGVAGYATAARPGAFAATIAGCVALGGGATYCATEGIPDVLRSQVLASAEPRKRESVPKPAAVVPVPQAVAPPAPGLPVPSAPVPSHAGGREPRERAVISRQRERREAGDAIASEFGFEGDSAPTGDQPGPNAGVASTTGSGGGTVRSTSPSAPPPKPAPPARTPGEFDP